MKELKVLAVNDPAVQVYVETAYGIIAEFEKRATAQSIGRALEQLKETFK